MSTYKAIVGKKIKSVSSDPTDSVDGQMWYNTATQSLRGLAISEAWSSAPNLGTGGYLAGSFGTQTAGVKVGGTYYPNTPMANVEHYNGVGWSEETNMPTAGQAISGAGTQTAGVIAGGSTPSMTANAFTYNGTSWTAANSLPYVANNLASCGLTQSSVIYAVGRDGSSGNSGTNKSITFDGTNFANGPNINVTRMFNTTSGSGTGTAALIFGGFIDPSPNNMTNCEEYDGTSWSNTDTLDTGTGFSSGWGTQTNTVAQTKASSYSGSEAYNGTSWSALPPTGATSSGGLYGIAAGATGDAGWLGAINPSGTVYATTVEFNRSLNVVTGAAWASGGAIPSAAMRNGAGAGTQTAGLIAGGFTTSGTSEAYLYDGNTWTATGDIPAAREGIKGCGTQTAAFAIGGRYPSPTIKAETFIFGGSSWTAAPSLPTATTAMGVFGTTSAAVAASGSTSVGPANSVTTSYEYDGSSWTAGNSMSTSRNNASGFGIQTAGAISNGYSPGSSSYLSATEEYDGTNYSTGGAMVVASSGACASGASQTNAILFSGRSSANNGEQRTYGYDGTSWSTRPSMANNHYQQALGGTSSTTTFIAGGGPKGSGSPDNVTNTEEFTPETEAANIETFSTS